MGYRMLQAMETGKVHLLPGLFAERAEVNRAYLMETGKSGAFAEFLSGGRHHHAGTAGGGRTGDGENDQDDCGEK